MWAKYLEKIAIGPIRKENSDRLFLQLFYLSLRRKFENMKYEEKIAIGRIRKENREGHFLQLFCPSLRWKLNK